MLKLAWILTLSLFLSLNSHAAFDGYEDTQEFLANQPLIFKSEAPLYTHYFKLIHHDGAEEVLARKNSHRLVKPASTMKIFTGWWAFQENVRSHDYLATMMKTSSNQMAQETLDLLGSNRDMELYYEGLGLNVNRDTLQVADGSGLSYANQSNCDIQVELLQHIYESADFEEFRELMAKPAETGTLVNRLHNLKGKVFAKTGTLRATIALSGFMIAPKGVVLFCMMSDFLTTTLQKERARVDAFVTQQFQQASLIED